jgi:ABC-type antimicrobial peptide transport system permease subunit
MKTLLLRNQEKKQLIIALLGLLIGYVFLSLSIHFFVKISSKNEKTDILGSDILLVQRKISNFSTLSLIKPHFSEDEIKNLQNAEGISIINPVTNNSFAVSFETNDKLVPYLRSDIFLQSVPENFLDIQKKDWDWKTNDKIVPIALPRDFVLMLNSFMVATNMPQLSDDLIKDVKFKFTIGYGPEKEWFDAKIIGFTNEFNAILIPETFMNYCNNKHGNMNQLKINQLIVKGKEGEFGKLATILEKKGLEAKSNQMITARLKSILEKTVMLTSVISVLTLLLSGLIMIQFLQLLMSRNAYEIKTLLLLGYTRKDLQKVFMKYFIVIFGIMGILGCITFLALKPFVENIVVSSGFPLDLSFSTQPYLGLFTAFCLFIVASFLTASRELNLLSK